MVVAVNCLCDKKRHVLQQAITHDIVDNVSVALSLHTDSMPISFGIPVMSLFWSKIVHDSVVQGVVPVVTPSQDVHLMSSMHACN